MRQGYTGPTRGTELLSVHYSLSRRPDRDRRPSTVLLTRVKHTISLRLLLVLSALLPLAVSAQHLTYPEWQARSQVDARLKPHFQGHVFTPEQRISNDVLVTRILESEPDRRVASERLVQLGLQHLQEGDLVSAMYRFNHAWLVDSSNATPFHGYGLFFLALDRNTEAGQQFADGLAMDSTHVPLLREMASTLIAGQYVEREKHPERADTMVRTARALLDRAYRRAPEDAAVVMQRTVCSLLLKECEDARTWYARYLATDDDTDARPLQAAMDRECPRAPTSGKGSKR